ncbi:MAG: 4'-phosphopantetheinyl transferase superfamily protein [Balneolaceae bacterium]
MNYLLESYPMILSRASQLYTDKLLSEEDRHKASRYIRAEDRDRFIAARILFYAYLKSKIPSFESLKDLTYDRYGKPFLDAGGFSFNWSHSGDLIALIVGKTECGIDVELHSAAPLFDYRSVCTEKEWMWIADGEKSSRFYQLWTAKESVLKATGFGLSINPADIEVLYQNEREFSGTLPGGKKYYGCSYTKTEAGNVYSISWCTGVQTVVSPVSAESILKELFDNG